MDEIIHMLLLTWCLTRAENAKVKKKVPSVVLRKVLNPAEPHNSDGKKETGLRKRKGTLKEDRLDAQVVGTEADLQVDTHIF